MRNWLAKSARKSISWLLGSAVLTLGLLPLQATSSSYTYTVLVQPGDVIDGHTFIGGLGAAINDNGEVAFRGYVPCASDLGCPAVFKTSLAGPPSFVAGAGTTIGGQTLTSAGTGDRLEVDNNGNIYFYCFWAGGGGICTQSSIVVQTGQSIGGVTLQEVGEFSVSKSGLLVFVGGFGGRIIEPGEPPTSAITLGLFTPSELLLKSCELEDGGNYCVSGGAEGDSVGGVPVHHISKPVINNDGTIAFACSLGVVCTTSSVLAQNGTVIGGTTLTDAFAPTINNGGTVEFIGDFNTSSGSADGIFTPSGAIIKAGDMVDGKAVPAFVGVANGTFLSLGDDGTVVFNTDFPRNSSCFVGPIAVVTQYHIIGESCDTFAGHQVRYVTALDESINSAGDIVFDTEYVPEEKDAIVLASPCGPPSITSVSASPSEIWPPDRKMIPVTIGYTGSSSCNASYSLTVNGTGGSSSVTDDHHVELQALEDAVYTITITGTNSTGNSTATVQVTVPHDVRP